MEQFAKLIPQHCTVVRAGRELDVPAADLVPGDIVRVKYGEKVPAVRAGILGCNILSTMY